MVFLHGFVDAFCGLVDPSTGWKLNWIQFYPRSNVKRSGFLEPFDRRSSANSCGSGRYTSHLAGTRNLRVSESCAPRVLNLSDFDHVPGQNVQYPSQQFPKFQKSNIILPFFIIVWYFLDPSKWRYILSLSSQSFQRRWPSRVAHQAQHGALQPAGVRGFGEGDMVGTLQRLQRCWVLNSDGTKETDHLCMDSYQFIRLKILWS